MGYREHPGPPAVAAERFLPGTDWLIGEGDGHHVILEAITT